MSKPSDTDPWLAAEIEKTVQAIRTIRGEHAVPYRPSPARPRLVLIEGGKA